MKNRYSIETISNFLSSKGYTWDKKIYDSEMLNYRKASIEDFTKRLKMTLVTLIDTKNRYTNEYFIRVSDDVFDISLEIRDVFGCVYFETKDLSSSWISHQKYFNSTTDARV